MRKPSPIPLELPQFAFSYAAAIEAGMTPERLRASDLSAPFVGVRTTGAPATRTERARALGMRLKDGQAISGLAAAELWGMRVPSRNRFNDNDVEILTKKSVSRVRIDGVVNRRIRDDLFRTSTLDNIPVVSPVLAMFTSAIYLAEEDVTVMLDAMLTASDVYRNLRFGSRPHLRPEQLPALVQTFRRMKGIDTVRAAIQLARPGVESPMETVLRLKLIAAELPEPVIQPVLILANGEEYRPDLGYPSANIYFDYDGEHHFVDQNTIDRDVQRDRELQDAGIRLVHVVKTDLNGRRFREIVRLTERHLARADAQK
ncbi:MAG: hypothetical protein ACTHXA_09875 [Gulosibacter sp.]|uniref:hypothetical protein n=1 Tax=Gulosibacter sp. TaxID=2817531 RepID=UPI003F90983F